MSATDTFKTSTGFGGGDWSIGVTFNLTNPDQLAGSYGLSGELPMSTLGLLCRTRIFNSSGMWGFACQTRKLGLSGAGTSVGFGFVGLSGPSFLTYSPGTSIATDLYSWQAKIWDGSVLRRAKRLIDSLGGVPTSHNELLELYRQLNELPIPQV